MITVSISINGEPLFARSARNHSEENEKGETKYVTDANDVIWHVRGQDRGIFELAKVMLDTIKTENL